MSRTGQKTRANAKQDVKNLVQAGNWSKTFPAKMETETKSCVFVKKLLTVSISNITYLRSMFPEEAYSNRSMDGLPLKILMEKNKCKAAATLAGWLVGAFDALERRYLRELLFIIYVDPALPDKVHEMYTFKFSYPGGKVACQMLQGEEKKEVENIHPDTIYKSTQNLLRSIISITQGLSPLPPSAYLSMKLTYYDDVTPEDYEPAGFGPAEHQDVQFPLGSLHLGAGDVTTSHHAVKLRVDARQVEHDVEQPMMVTNTYSATESDSEPSRANVGDAGDTLPTPVTTTISCTCLNTTQDLLMLTCHYCCQQQHAACYRLTQLSMLPAVHCCVDCSKEGQGDRVCTDKKLVKMSAKPAVVLTCIFRRALVALMEMEKVGLDFFMEKFGLSRDIAEGILGKMVKEGTILQGEEDCFRVDKRTLEMVAIPKYLGVKRAEDRNLESILEKTGDMDIGGGDVDQVGRGVKRVVEVEVKENKERVEEENLGRRSSKRIKMSRTEEHVSMATENN